MLFTYDQNYLHQLHKMASENHIDFQFGIYLALQGPSLETPAEYNYIHHIGADLVGMSTVPEVIVSKHMGMKITVLSVVSNVCFPIETLTETTIAQVIETAAKTIPSLNILIRKWVSFL
jgi:purine-nucleoside phosphorylase